MSEPVLTETNRHLDWVGGGIDHRTEWYCLPPAPGAGFEITQIAWRTDPDGVEVREIHGWLPLP